MIHGSRINTVAGGPEQTKHIVVKAKTLCLGESLIYVNMLLFSKAGLEIGIRQIEK